MEIRRETLELVIDPRKAKEGAKEFEKAVDSAGAASEKAAVSVDKVQESFDAIADEAPKLKRVEDAIKDVEGAMEGAAETAANATAAAADATDKLDGATKRSSKSTNDWVRGFKDVEERLKSVAGNRSTVKDLFEILAGAGAVAGLTMAGNLLANMTRQMNEGITQYAVGAKTAGQLADQFARSVPVLGNIYATGQNIRDIFEGTSVFVAKANAEAVKLNETLQQIAGIRGTSDAIVDTVNERIESIRSKLESAETTPYGRLLLAADRATADRDDAMTKALTDLQKENAERLRLLQAAYDTARMAMTDAIDRENDARRSRAQDRVVNIALESYTIPGVPFVPATAMSIDPSFRENWNLARTELEVVQSELNRANELVKARFAELQRVQVEELRVDTEAVIKDVVKARVQSIVQSVKSIELKELKPSGIFGDALDFTSDLIGATWKPTEYERRMVERRTQLKLLAEEERKAQREAAERERERLALLERQLNAYTAINEMINSRSGRARYAFDDEGRARAERQSALDRELQVLGINAPKDGFDSAAEIAKMRAAGMTDQQVRDAIQELNNLLEETARSAEKAAERLDKLSDGLAQGISSNLKSALMDGSFDDFGQNVMKAIQSALLDAFVIDPMTDLLSNVAKNMMRSFASSMLTYRDGGAFMGGSVVPMASGSVVLGPTLRGLGNGRLALMGEAGPEAILPLGRDANGRLGVRSNGRDGGSTTIIQHINVRETPMRGFGKTMRQLAADSQYSGR